MPYLIFYDDCMTEAAPVQGIGGEPAHILKFAFHFNYSTAARLTPVILLTNASSILLIVTRSYFDIAI